MRSLVALAFLSAGCACGGPNARGDDDLPGPGVCSDEDGDGYGAGAACTGPDCDDSNPDVFRPDDCEALCAADPHSTGCACDGAAFPEPETCYTGDPETMGVGPCRAGLRRCDEGAWGPCVDQVLPSEEVCDHEDDDCSGEIDEGVLNACGNCDDDCESDCLGAGCDDTFDVETEGDNVEECEGVPDCVTLGGRTLSLHVIWIANSSEGTVSRIDTRTREEEGRYLTSDIGPTGSPSRTSVDYLGDVVVGNRAFGAQASVTRIASDTCPDENADGRIQTSTGGADVLPWGEDECVLWNTDVGCGPDGGAFGAGCGIARAVAVQDRAALDGALDEVVWVGLFNERGYVELDRNDGRETGVFADCSPCTPYGAAIDRDGILSSACLSQNLCRFDTASTDDVEVLVQPGSNYGITVDENGIVWTGGSCTKYDPESGEFTPIPGCSGNGIGADGEGWVWVGRIGGGFGGGGITRIDVETLETFDVAADGFGIGVDFDGFIWAVPYSMTYVDVVDPGTGPGDETIERVELGLTGPYTYSDMTGYQLRNATDPAGRYTHVFAGCEDAETDWTAVTWESTTPPGTSIVISVRSANEIADLAAHPFLDAGSAPTDDSPLSLDEIDLVDARYLEVQFTLLSETREDSPMLLGMGVQWSCGTILQ